MCERLLRYYAERGLLRPRRDRGGYGDYSEGDLRVVARIRTLLAAGLSTVTIVQALPCVVDGAPGGPAPTYTREIAELRAERERIDREIARPPGIRAHLNAVLAASR